MPKRNGNPGASEYWEWYKIEACRGVTLQSKERKARYGDQPTPEQKDEAVVFQFYLRSMDHCRNKLHTFGGREFLFGFHIVNVRIDLVCGAN